MERDVTNGTDNAGGDDERRLAELDSERQTILARRRSGSKAGQETERSSRDEGFVSAFTDALAAASRGADVNELREKAQRVIDAGRDRDS